MSSDSNQDGAPVPTLVVMAAGIGSRYGGLKQVDPVGPAGEMILDYSVYDAVRAGFGKVVFVIRRDIETDFREAIGRRIEPRVDTDYAYQSLDALPEGRTAPGGRVKPWGTGHAVLCARDQVGGPFAAINADDFYGRGAFKAVGSHIMSLPAPGDVDEYSMAGYRLANTLSEHGHVSRGVCEVSDDGFLERIVERTKIRRFDEGIRYQSEEGEWASLPDEATVSMNIWGFSAGFLNKLEAGFERFLDSHLDEEGAEFYLPSAVSDLIASGEARVRVLPTDEHWFGITYREDMPVARAAIRERIAGGLYPERLWE